LGACRWVAWMGWGVVWGTTLAGGRCVRRIARCVLEGRAAMDAGNGLGPEGAASLAPALEEMTQLTSLDLQCARIRFWARRLGVWGSFSLVRAVGYALGCDVVWSGYDACGRAISATDCEVCAEGRVAMDAGNDIGPEGAASLAPALEKMPQLTFIDLQCARNRLWARRRGVWGSSSLVRAVGYALGWDGVWFGVRACGRACDACDGLRGVCLRGGRRWMQGISSGLRGRHRWRRRWRRCRSSPRSTSEVRGIAFGRGVGAFGGLFLWCVVFGTRLDAVWCGWGMRLRAGDACDGLRGVCLRGRAAMDADF
jgi:hypothetical protein